MLPLRGGAILVRTSTTGMRPLALRALSCIKTSRHLVRRSGTWCHRPSLVTAAPGSGNGPFPPRASSPPSSQPYRAFVSSTPFLHPAPPQPENRYPPPFLPNPPKTNLTPASTPPRRRENIYTLPNLLTASRLVAAPFIGYAILHNHHALALSLFAYAGLTDALDGWIARRYHLGTVLGTIIDPLADKTLMTILTVTLAAQGSLPPWLAVLILGRDAALGVAAVYYRWISLPPPKTWGRYWDFSLPSAEVHPTTISKYNTFLQLGLMGATMVAPVLTSVEMGGVLEVGQWVVAGTTVWSGASYVYSKDAVKILPHSAAAGGKKGEDGKDGKDGIGL